MEAYAPDRGHIVWLTFEPHTGHEQAGRRPALVLSPKSYNLATSLAIFCPITSAIKGNPFEVRVPDNPDLFGVVLADQVKSLDWRVRKAEYLCAMPTDALAEVLGKLKTLIG
jgi:mRNA interferase MazF